jgi:hypothetical protein
MSLSELSNGLNSLSTGAQRAINAIGSIPRSVNSIASDLGSLRNTTTVGDALGTLSNVTTNVGRIAGALKGITNPSQLGSAIRSINLPIGGQSGIPGISRATFSGDTDWRVKLTSPIGEIIFPYTPSINLSGSASYDEVTPVHQNYQFVFFQNGRVDPIQIVAPFNVEDFREVDYWIKVVGILRRSVKMLPDGNPPPICKLSGYGSFVLPNIPCVVKSWTIDLPQDVNYIGNGDSWAPSKSTLNLTLQPVYSREDSLYFDPADLVKKGSKFI